MSNLGGMEWWKMIILHSQLNESIKQRRGRSPLQNLATSVFGRRTAESCGGKPKFNKMCQKARSEKHRCYPVLTYDLSLWQMGSIHLSVPRAADLSPNPTRWMCHSSCLEDKSDHRPGFFFCLVSAWLSDGCRLHTVVLYIFISLIPFHILTCPSDCCAVCLTAALIWYVVHSCIQWQYPLCN